MRREPGRAAPWADAAAACARMPDRALARHVAPAMARAGGHRLTPAECTALLSLPATGEWAPAAGRGAGPRLLSLRRRGLCAMRASVVRGGAVWRITEEGEQVRTALLQDQAPGAADAEPT